MANPDRASFSIALLDAATGTTLQNVGNVTCPPNKAMPQPGDIVDVRYLYAYRGGSLYQPFFKGPRTDVDRAACTTRQLKY